MWPVLFLIANVVILALAETHHVDAGRTGLTFTPSALYNVAVGDVVNFHFYPTNQSVAESTFDSPCKPKPVNGDDKPIYSGFVPVSDGVASQMWSMTVNKTDTIWLYCSQGEHQHCRNGQSMVINPANDTTHDLEAYMRAALVANVSSPDEVFGGVLTKDDGGQSVQGPMARPLTVMTASASATGSNGPTSSTSGVVSIGANLLWKSGAWGVLAVVFFVTL